ncbi:MAG: HlyD family efflux transporter periplasmic adaptor subunit [Planctomycetes bacterium]|nr:HlyD family efflux transporter periplasmic adaptor subunit [Planctomycetota bacterium]
MKTFRLILMLVLLVLGPVAGWWAHARYGQSAADKKAAELNTVQVVRGRIELKVKARGIVKPAPNALVRVGFPMPKDVARRISRMPVVEGDEVKEGQVLAELDPADLTAQLVQLQAEAAVFEEKLKALKAMETLEVKLAEVARDAAQAQLDHALRVASRYEKMTDKTGISTLEIDTAASDKLVSQARFNQAKASLEQVKGKFRTDIAVLEAQLKQAETAINNVRVQIGLCTMRSPISGQVFAIHIRQGETTGNLPNAPVLSLLDHKQLQLHLYVDESDFGRVKVGQPVTFRVDAYPAEILRGKIVRLLPQPILQENVVYYLTLVEVDEEQRALLRAEMTALGHVQAGGNDKALWLPLAAVRSRSNGWYVLRPGPRGPEEVPVQIGWKDEGKVEIRSGLNEGDEVLLD